MVRKFKALLSDSFEKYLNVLFVIIVLGKGYLFTRAIQSFMLVKGLYFVKKSDKDIKIGDVIEIEGKPKLILDALSFYDRELISNVWLECGKLSGSLYLKILWKHNKKYGRGNRIHIDKVYEVKVPFYIEGIDDKKYYLKQNWFDYYVLQSIRYDKIDLVRKYSKISEWVDIDYFLSDRVYVVGRIVDIKDDEIHVIAGNNKGKYFISKLPIKKVLVSHAASAIAIFILILFSICICFILRYEKIKFNFVESGNFIIFDKMGGNETVVFVLGILWFIFYFLVIIYVGPKYPYEYDFINSFWGLGLLLVYLLGQNVEWFYVYNCKDGFLYTASRGLLGQTFEKVTSMSNANVVLECRTVKNTNYYKLVAYLDGNSIDLTEETTNYGAISSLLDCFEKHRLKGKV